MLPFDLHVLSMPPAFNLSQDQTLHVKVFKVCLAELTLAPTQIALCYTNFKERTHQVRKINSTPLGGDVKGICEEIWVE